MSFNVASNDGRSPRGEDEDENIKEAGEASDDEPEVDDDMAAMQAMMGFGGFGTTKNKKIAGNNVGAVRKEKKTEYRQYMNRQGGFNRPLSPSR
jgi:U4/U6.U5 tri-snRNP-associated protein 3